MKRAATGAALIAVLAAIIAAVAIAGGSWRAGPAPTEAAIITTPPPRPTDARPLTVLSVYDGDTIQAAAPADTDRDAGTAAGTEATAQPIRIRLIGIDTPELGTPGLNNEPDTPDCWANEATAHLRELLPEGATVWAVPGIDAHDDYGRALFDLWTDDGRLVAAELVTAGDARTMRIAPNVTYSEVLATLQTDARATGRGQWGACP